MRAARRIAAAAGVCLAVAGPATQAAAIELRLPVDCRLGETCMIQQYVDRDPGSGATDHRCASLSYDGHKGTDIRLQSLAAMRAGVDVLAAADGVVAGVRDGMPDIRFNDPGAPDLEGRDCGNGVRIVHADGWSTQYCHLQEGSVSVAKGTRVAAGQPIGRIGLSGRTEFPHVHLTLRDGEGRVVDPFDGRSMDTPCGAKAAGDSLWADPTLAHVPGGVVSAGMLGHVPSYEEVRAEAPSVERLPGDAQSLIAWTFFFGVMKGDRLAISIRAPGGGMLVSNTHVMDRNRAAEFRAIGRRRPEGGWPAGAYEGRAALIRNGSVVATRRMPLTVE